MDNRTTFVAALMFSAALAVASSPVSPTHPFDDITTALEEYRVPLASVAVTIGESTHSLIGRRGGHIAATDGRAGGAPIFEAASLGKVVTAYIVCRLADTGAISLDEPVFPYLDPEWTADEGAHDITLRMLLSHTAGYGNSIIPLDRTVYDVPGARFRYSGVGYVAVMRVLEHKTGLPFQTLAENHVFTPLGMDSSSFVTDRSILSRKAAPHLNATTALVAVVIPAAAIFTIGALVTIFVLRIAKRRARPFLVPLAVATALVETALFLVVAPRFLPVHGVVWGATVVCIVATRLLFKRGWIGLVAVAVSLASLLLLAGDAPIPLRPEAVTEPNAAYTFHTTGDDLSRFVRALADDFREPYLRPMFTPHVPIDEHMSWTSGLGVETRRGRTLYWHWGSNMGFKSLLVIDPAARTTSVVLTNSDNGLEVSHTVARAIHGAAFRLRLPE